MNPSTSSVPRSSVMHAAIHWAISGILLNSVRHGAGMPSASVVPPGLARFPDAGKKHTEKGLAPHRGAGGKAFVGPASGGAGQAQQLPLAIPTADVVADVDVTVRGDGHATGVPQTLPGEHGL